ncbi:MAG: hypothetical protein ACE5QV_06080 [Fidelibacterota bacterium]
MWQGWLAGFIGLWLILSSFVSSLRESSANYILFGLIASYLGFRVIKNLLGRIVGFLGVWLIFSGIIVFLKGFLNIFLVGIIIGFISFLILRAKTES